MKKKTKMYNLEKLNQLLIDNNIEATPDCDMTGIRIAFEADNTLSIRIYENLINICTDDEINNGFLPNFSLLEKVTKTLQLIQECHYEEKQIDVSKEQIYCDETGTNVHNLSFWCNELRQNNTHLMIAPDDAKTIAVDLYRLKKITKITIED